jgi:pilus assembly protein CpaE
MSDTMSESAGTTSLEVLAPVPRVTLQAFCETHDVAAALQSALSDRRLGKVQGRIQMGGPTAAAEVFRDAPTPNVIVLETLSDSTSLISNLEKLSEVCDAGTKVVVIGHVNDILLYRDLVRRGVSDYLIAPLDTLDVVRAICDLYSSPTASRVGRTMAFVGAKGGVGSSTLAHNVAWAISKQLDSTTVIVDLDVAFGTAGLDFNQDPPQGIAEALFTPDRLDSNLLDRLMSRCTDNLLMLAAPAVLDRTCDFPEDILDSLMDLLRQTAPSIVLDVPHNWQSWTRKALISADEVAIVASPDLASLRNAKNMVDLLRQHRPNDAEPRLVLNQTGIAKRPEIGAAEFAKALKLDPVAVIPFDAQLFGTAANNGQMIAEIQPAGKTAEELLRLASVMTGRSEGKRTKRNLLEPLLAKLMRKKAS